MALGEQGYSDRKENHVDAYTITINGSTSTAIDTTGVSPYNSRPIVLFGISITVNPSISSGSVVFHDASASGDTSAKYVVNISSAGSQNYSHVMNFERPITFQKNVMMVATTITGSINLQYKQRFS